MKQLLIIRFSALGDVAMLVPVVQALAMSYPDWQITILSRPHTASLFHAIADNVHFIGADLKGKHRNIQGLNQLLQDIDYQRFDKVADMHSVLRSRYLTMRFVLAGKQVATIHKGRIDKWLLIHRHHLHTNLPTTIQRYTEVLAKLGFYPKLKPIQTSAQPRIGIGIAPFAAHQGKTYPLKHMEEVVKLLSQQGETIYLFGAGEKEKNILQTWETKYPHVESLAGKYTLQEEIKHMQTLRLMLTMDSANMHLASIAGTRVLSIWGATHPAAGFLGFGQKVEDCIQRNLPCRPCSIYGNKPCQYQDYRCLHITPKEVVEHINAALCKS